MHVSNTSMPGIGEATDLSSSDSSSPSPSRRRGKFAILVAVIALGCGVATVVAENGGLPVISSGDSQKSASAPQAHDAEPWTAPSVSFSLIAAELNGIEIRNAKSHRDSHREATSSSPQNAALGTVAKEAPAVGSSIASMLSSGADSARVREHRNEIIHSDTNFFAPSNPTSATQQINGAASASDHARPGAVHSFVGNAAATTLPEADAASGNGSGSGKPAAIVVGGVSEATSSVGSFSGAMPGGLASSDMSGGGGGRGESAVLLGGNDLPAPGSGFFSQNTSIDNSDAGGLPSSNSASPQAGSFAPSLVGKNILGESQAGGTLRSALVEYAAAHSVANAVSKPTINKNQGSTRRRPKSEVGGHMHRDSFVDLTNPEFTKASLLAPGGAVSGGESPREADMLFQGSALPEPASMSLLALGALGLLSSRRRAKSR